MSNDNNTGDIHNHEGEHDNANTETTNVGGAGFEEEGGIRADAQDRKPVKDKHTFSKNLTAVFGSGVGRISIIVCVFVLICFVAFAYRGLTKSQPVIASKAKVDIPVSPRSDKTIADPVTEKELARRSQQAQKEAELAAKKGSTYQPAFDPRVVKEGEEDAPETPVVKGSVKDAQFNVETDADAAKNKANASTPPAASGLSVNAAANGNGGNNGGQKANQQAQAEAQRELQRQQKIEQEYQMKLKARDAYIKEVRQKIADQAKEIIGTPETQTTVANQGVYGRAIYYSEKDNAGGGGNTANSSGEHASGGKNEASQSKTTAKVKPLIKTGNILYAELDSEVNTDDGNDVFATIRGGAWDGSKIIGKIVTEPDNIALKFTILAPQDDRPTMQINAMAMREEDAKLGVAEDIDRHILSRYGSLAVASLMSGYGKAYARAGTQTVVLPGGGVLQTNGDPTTRQVVGQAVGEMGTAMSNEIRKNFNQPTTYSTPAQHGIGVYFMADVLPPKN